MRDLRNRRQFRTSGFRGSSIDAAQERLAPQEALEVVQEERDQPVVFIDMPAGDVWRDDAFGLRPQRMLLHRGCS